MLAKMLLLLFHMIYNNVFFFFLKKLGATLQVLLVLPVIKISQTVSKVVTESNKAVTVHSPVGNFCFWLGHEILHHDPVSQLRQLSLLSSCKKRNLTPATPALPFCCWHQCMEKMFFSLIL